MLRRLFHFWEKRLALRDTNRRLLPFDLGVEWVPEWGSGGDGDNPAAHLRAELQRALDHSDQFFSYSPVKDFTLADHLLRFRSPVASAYESNNVAQARYFPADSKGRAVVVLPQWNADRQGHMNLCRMLNFFGLTALRLSLPYHDDRTPPGCERADYMVSSNVGRTVHACRQAVVEGRAAIDWLQSQGYHRFGILGTSLGSCIALITTAHEPRISAQALNHISTYFADVVWRGISTAHVQQSMAGNITLEELRDYWRVISPASYLGRLQGTSVQTLLIHARYDLTFPTDLTKQTIELFRKLGLPHRRLCLPCGHYTTGVGIFKWLDALAMCRFLRDAL
ncbi:MAG: abhydrolase domain-containing 18 [Acidobacteria bacterium]|nr:abhydrolase domain-containing 18 [Acidobacteriota bacterium]